TIMSSFLPTLPPTPSPPLFPYTTLFRSQLFPGGGGGGQRLRADQGLHGRLLRLWAGRSRQVPQRLHRHLRDHGRGQGQEPRHPRSEEHTSELQSLAYLVCRLLLEKKNNN